MNDSCFKAKKEFEKGKREFLKFPNNMGRRLIHLNIKKKYKKALYLTEKAFKEKNLHKIAKLNKKDPKQFRTSIKSLLRDTVNKTANRIHPNTWKPYFQKLLNIQKKNENEINTEQKLLNLENKLQGSLGPLDYDFTVEQIIAAIKSFKLNKANFGLVSNEILRCNPETIALLQSKV